MTVLAYVTNSGSMNLSHPIFQFFSFLITTTMVHISSVIFHGTLFHITSSQGNFSGNLAGVILENSRACIRAVVNNPSSYMCSYHWHIFTLVLHSCTFNPEWILHILIQNLAIYDISVTAIHANPTRKQIEEIENRIEFIFSQGLFVPTQISFKTNINQIILNRLIYKRLKSFNLPKWGFNLQPGESLRDLWPTGYPLKS